MLTQSVVNPSTLPVITGTLQLQPYSQWRTFRFWILVGVLLLATSHGIWHPTQSPSWDHSIHPDQTTIAIPQHQVDQRIVLVYQKDGDGKLVRVLADPDRYSAMIHDQVAKLETARLTIREQVKIQLTNDLDELFEEVRQRSPLLSDYYFSYSTHFDLFLTALTAAIDHLGEDHFQEQVSRDVEAVIQNQYERIVLQPEILNAEIEMIYAQAVQNAHQSYLQVIAKFESEFQQFLAQQTTYLERDNYSRPEIRLDFVTQIRKLRRMPMPEVNVLRSLMLTTMGGLAGKGIGIQVGSLLATRLALPFTQRALMIVGSGTVGASAGIPGGPLGSALGGALGVVIGAATGVVLDMAIQKGIETFDRPQFEEEVRTAINSTQTQWLDKLLESLLKSVDVKFDDTIQLVLTSSQN